MANILGLITVNGKQILEVDADPAAGGGTAAPLGSLASFDNGTIASLHFKKALADTGWDIVDLSEGNDWTIGGNQLTGASPTTPDQYLGSANDYDFAFRRNGVEQMRIANGAILIGLAASLGGRLQIAGAALGADLVKEISPNGGAGDQVIHVSRQFKVLTTDAVLTTLGDLLIPNDRVVHITAKVAARQTGGSAGAAGDGAAYTREIHARSIAAVAAIRMFQASFTSEDVPAFNLTAIASGANVRLQAQGALNRNVSWFAHTELLIAGA